MTFFAESVKKASDLCSASRTASAIRVDSTRPVVCEYPSTLKVISATVLPSVSAERGCMSPTGQTDMFEAYGGSSQTRAATRAVWLVFALLAVPTTVTPVVYLEPPTNVTSAAVEILKRCNVLLAPAWSRR